MDSVTLPTNWNGPRFAPLLFGKGRPLAILLAVGLSVSLACSETRLEIGLRHLLFDAYQVLMPRERYSDSVIVVAIDDASLRKIGQWPWPRTQLAELIDRIAEYRPAGIGLDMLFAEADRFSPERMAAQLPTRVRAEINENLDWPDFDNVLGASLQRANATLAVAGLLEKDEFASPPVRVPMVLQSDPETELDDTIWNFPATLTSIGAIDGPGLGRGLVNAIPRDSLVKSGRLMGRHDEVMRRLPAVSMARGNLMPAFSVEVLRRALGAPWTKVIIDRGQVRALEFADRRLPLSADGSWWVHYSPPDERPTVPAHYFLGEGSPTEFDLNILTGRIILLGPVASGLNDLVETPLGIMPGVNVHAEAIDNVLDGRLLSRPNWGLSFELAALVLGAALFILCIPVLDPQPMSALALACFAVLLLLGAGFFKFEGWLVDVLNPVLASLLVGSVMIASSVMRADQLRVKMRLELQRSREDKARIEGTLDAARRIQLGMLPNPRALSDVDARFELAATMLSASSVGGDLYDFFKIDQDRLFFVLGDVSGKGVPASLFMALSKTLIKDAAQYVSSDPGKCLSEASRRIADENPESLFVSGVACLLDLRTGQLSWCSAGHDNPLIVASASNESRQLKSEGGPALCVVDEFDYPTEQQQLMSGDLICLISDGVTEAENAQAEQYGMQRLTECLHRSRFSASQDIIEAVQSDVQNFVGDQEFGDDFTIVAMRWIGP